MLSTSLSTKSPIKLTLLLSSILYSKLAKKFLPLLVKSSRYLLSVLTLYSDESSFVKIKRPLKLSDNLDANLILSLKPSLDES